MPDRELEILEERLVQITQGMIDAGVEVLDSYDGVLSTMATTYDSIVDDRDSAEEIVAEIWRAMTEVWLKELPPKAQPCTRAAAETNGEL